MNNIRYYIDALSETKQKIFFNVFWALLGKIVNVLGVLFVGILVARYLGPEQYGLMNYVISYVSIFTIIACFGLDNIEIRELSHSPERKDVILGTAFNIRMALFVITFILLICTLIVFKTDLYTSILILVYGTSMFSACFNVIRNFFTSIVKNKYIVLSEIFRTVVSALIKIILLWIEAPLIWFVVSMALDTVIIANGYLYAYHKKVGKTKQWLFDKQLAIYLIREAFPLVLSGAAIIIYQKIDQVMIGNMIDDQSVGYFATAGKFTDLILLLPTIMSQTITPILVKLYKDNKILYEEKKQQFVDIIVWSSIVLSLFVSLSSYYLIFYSFGQQYLPAVPVLQIIAWKTVGMALATTSGQIMIIEHIQKWVAIRNVVACFVCIAMNFLLIPKFGIIGSAWTTIATILFASFLSNLFIPQYYGIMKIQIKSIFLGWTCVFKLKKVI